MKQTTKFLHILMCMVLGLSVSMTSCKDYDDDIDGLNQRVDALEKRLSELSTDFGELAYVQSVTFENGVLTVTPSVGEPVPYTLPNNAVVYGLQIEEKDGVVTVTLVKDGENSSDSFKLPAAAAGFDAKNLTVKEDGYLYYGDVKTEVKLALDPTLDIREVTDGAGNIIAYTIAYNGKTTTLQLIPGKLQGLVFIPQLSYLGHEAMRAATYEYYAYTGWEKGNANGYGEKGYVEPVQSTKLSSLTPLVYADYHMNPSNVSEDLLALENMSFLAKDVPYSKAVKPTIIDREVKKGILTVYSNLSGLIKDIATDEEVTLLALQVGTRGVNGDTLITSDYAAVKKSVISDIVLSKVVKEPAVCTQVEGVDHLYSTLEAAMDENATTFELLYNDEDGIDIAELIQSHYKAEGGHKVWDENANAGTVEKSGFKYVYDLIGYSLGENETSQSAHAALKGSLLRAQDTKGGLQQEWGASQSRSLIGRQPIVRVTLMDTVAIPNAPVAIGYMKFNITSEVEPEEDIVTVIPTFAIDSAYTVSCRTAPFEFDLNWAQVEEMIYSHKDVNLSKDEFENLYKLDGFDANVSTSMATQFDAATSKAKPVTTPIGKVVITTDDEASSMTEVLRWTVTADEAYNNLVKKESISVIVRFVREMGTAHHYVYVTFNWTPQPRYVTPSGKVDDASKIANYWYAQASLNAGLDEVHAHVEVPDVDSDCRYVKDLLDFFEGGKIRVQVNNAEIYTDFVDAKLTKTLKFIEPRVKEATGVSGDTYVLGVTSDGSALVAEKKVSASTKADVNSPKVVVLNGTTVEYQSNETALDLLNFAGRTEMADGQTLAGRIGIEAENVCKKPIDLENETFEVRFIRPISVLNKENDGLVDATDNGDDIDLDEFIAFEDWRGIEFTAENDYFDYYDVQKVNIEVDSIRTDLNGNDITKALLTEVAPKIDVTFTAPAADALSLTNMGTLTYKNNGGELREEFKIRVPVEVTYKWGKVVVYMDITVHETI